ncbi:MAG: hypothetical protein QG646_1217 [Euryarchaeota archaeon]|nr:hypothetical protein [Euryarchaeota archaeon]
MGNDKLIKGGLGVVFFFGIETQNFVLIQNYFNYSKTLLCDKFKLKLI